MGKADDWGLTIVDGRGTIELCKVVILGLLLSTSVWAVNGDMGVGTQPLTDGSAAYPWLIEDLADFDRFADSNNAATYWAVGVNTKMMTDIDLSGRTYTTAVIAPDGSDFRGVFDGNNHVVSKMTIDTAGANNNCLGLFGRIIGINTEIKNLGVTSSRIIGLNYSFFSFGIGGLCAANLGESTGYGGTIRNCFVKDSVISAGDNTVAIGGLCGANRGSIMSCYADVAVTAGHSSYIGGLCGDNYKSGFSFAKISLCYAAGTISAGSYSEFVGGLCGWNSCIIENCYSTASVTAADYRYSIGGFVGCNRYDGNIRCCYSTGKVVSWGSSGGFLGGGQPVYYSFWDVETSGIGNPGDSHFGAIGKTTVQMKTQSTFAGWDFSVTDGDEADWMMLREGEDYPRLAWQEVYAGDVAGLYGVDMVDFAEIARNWLEVGCPANCEEADIDGSGVVELGDVAILADGWLKQ